MKQDLDQKNEKRTRSKRQGAAKCHKTAKIFNLEFEGQFEYECFLKKKNK